MIPPTVNSQGARLKTLVVDTGTEIVGIFSVLDGVFTPYQGERISIALERIKNAAEIVVYGGELPNGQDYDLTQLGKFAGTSGEFQIRGVYTDMRLICWPWAAWGSSLRRTYERLFTTCPEFPDTYEGAVQSDCYMAWKLWERWKEGTLTL
jgi:hypothetical protein